MKAPDEITRLLLNMRDNCVRKTEGEAYDDPERKEKYEALNAAIDLINNPSLLHMTGDLISRKALVKALLAWRDKYPPETDERYSFGVKVQNRFNTAFRGGIRKALMETETAPSVDAVPVVHGRWILEAHDERVNCRWNVTARCSECSDECREIWAGFFPGVPDCIAKDVAIQDARQVELSNYCPNCGARMDKEGD